MAGKVEGNVALITNLPGAGSLEQRSEGFTEQLEAKYPGLKLVADKYADGQATTGLNITTDLITANPNLKGIFASNLIMAQGVGQAVAENKLGGKIALIGFDSDDKLIKLPQRRRHFRRSSSRIPTGWAMTASRPRSPPPRARRSRPMSTPAPTS